MYIGHINVAVVIDVRGGAIHAVRVFSEAASNDGDIGPVHDSIAIHVRR
jgi:hypothetical protein